MTHVENPQQLDDVDRAMQLGKMMGAKEQLIIAIDNALAGEESDGEEDEEEE
jgi:hypothetical protein